MRNPKTTIFGYLGVITGLATFLGVVGSACGGGEICGWFALGSLILNQLANAVGNILSLDGGH